LILKLNNINYYTMTPDQALQILTQIANAHLCTKQDRLVIDQALSTLASILPTATEPAKQ
jgi:hypothetical protein